MYLQIGVWILNKVKASKGDPLNKSILLFSKMFSYVSLIYLQISVILYLQENIINMLITFCLSLLLQPASERNSNSMHNVQKSASFMCKNRDINLQNIRKSPRLLAQNRRNKHVFESNQEGVNCISNSQIESLDKKKMCFSAEVILAKSQQSQDRSVEYERETNLQNVRRSPRLSEEARERDMQFLFESTEKVTICRKKSRIKNLNQERLFSPAEVKFVNMALVHSGSLKDEGEKDVQNTRILSRVSGKVLVVGQQSIADSSNKGVCSHESYMKNTCKSNLSLKTKAAPESMPQILNTGVNYDIIMCSKSIRKSARLSGKNGEGDLKEKKLLGEFSFATDAELTAVTQVQNKSSDCQGMNLKTIQRSLRLSCRSKETSLDSNIEYSEKGRIDPYENVSNLNNFSVVKLFHKPQVQNVSVNSNGHVEMKNRQKSSHLSGMKRQQDLQICSRKEFKLGAEYQKKGCHGNDLSLPIKFKLANTPSAQNQTVKSNKEEGNLRAKSQKKGFDGSTTSPPIEVELTSATSLHNKNVKDGCLLNKAIGSPLNSFKSLPPFQYYVSSGKGINLIVDLNSSPSDWTKKIFTTSSTSQSLQKNQFESFRHEIESLRSKKMISSVTSTISPRNIKNDACPKSISGETCPLRSWIPERGNGSSDITEANSCIDVRTGDGHLENSSDINTETSGDQISSSQKFLVLHLY